MLTYEQALPSSKNIVRHVLPNGAVILVHEKPTVQSVVIGGSLSSAGSVNTTPQQAGLADMTAEALMRGTHKRDFDTLHTELELLGADLAFSGGTFSMSFHGKALAEDLPTLLMLWADVLRNPSFDATQVERLRGELLTSLNYLEQDTRYRARRAFLEKLYPQTHPYHHRNNGTLQTVSALTVDDLRQFHAQHYGAQGLVLVIVGNVQAQQAIAWATEHIGDWQNAQQVTARALPAAPTVQQGERIHVPVAGKTQSDVMLGFVGPSRNAPDYHAAMLVNAVLGQFGMMGRIGDVVREEKGYAYYSYSSIEGGLAAGPWSGAAGVAPQNVDETITDILNEFQRITEELVSEEDLDNVQSYFTGSLPISLESSEGVTNTIMRMEIFGLGLDYLLHYRDEIMSITREDLLKAAQRYIDVNKAVIAVAGPAEGAR